MTRWILTPENRGRIVLITATLLMWLLILISFERYGYEATWRLWKVPAAPLTFLDFRLIPGSAESFRDGYEPAIENPHDPVDRIFNYPAFWRLFFYTGITQDDTVWISVLMIALFFIGVWVFPGRLEIMDAMIVLLVAFSPAVMLLCERGNVDLIVFFLCALILLVLDFHALAATALIMFATVVKVFPFFGVLVLLRDAKWKFIWLALGCLGVLVGYVAATYKSMSAAWNLTMRGKEISYGTNVLFLRYSQFFSEALQVSPTGTLMKYGPIILAGLLVVVVGLIGVRNRLTLASDSARNLAAFRMGAGIYMGTFLLGNNWDYRLAFLIFVVPQLLEWARGAEPGKVRAMSIAVLTLTLVSCWHFMVWYSPALAGIQETVFRADEFVNWMLLLGFGYLLAVSAPEWFKDLFQSVRRTQEAARSS